MEAFIACELGCIKYAPPTNGITYAKLNSYIPTALPKIVFLLHK